MSVVFHFSALVDVITVFSSDKVNIYIYSNFVALMIRKSSTTSSAARILHLSGRTLQNIPEICLGVKFIQGKQLETKTFSDLRIESVRLGCMYVCSSI